mgnify:CR=1 FL=1
MIAVSDAVVLVTGGRRGLGSALVDEVLARGARKVYATARDPYTDSRDRVVAQQLEVSSDESVTALAAVATDVDIVINNAGILLPGSLLTGVFSDIAATFDINAFGPLRVARAFAPILAANGGGALVNMLSVLSWVGGSAAYGASKAAAWSITNSLRGELHSQGTQVVGVHAGLIDTEMAAELPGPKTPAADIARRIIDGLEAGALEVLADDVTVAVKGALSGPVENLNFSLAI